MLTLALSRRASHAGASPPAQTGFNPTNPPLDSTAAIFNALRNGVHLPIPNTTQIFQKPLPGESKSALPDEVAAFLRDPVAVRTTLLAHQAAMREKHRNTVASAPPFARRLIDAMALHDSAPAADIVRDRKGRPSYAGDSRLNHILQVLEQGMLDGSISHLEPEQLDDLAREIAINIRWAQNRVLQNESMQSIGHKLQQALLEVGKQRGVDLSALAKVNFDKLEIADAEAERRLQQHAASAVHRTPMIKSRLVRKGIAAAAVLAVTGPGITSAAQTALHEPSVPRDTVMTVPSVKKPPPILPERSIPSGLDLKNCGVKNGSYLVIPKNGTAWGGMGCIVDKALKQEDIQLTKPQKNLVTDMATRVMAGERGYHNAPNIQPGHPFNLKGIVSRNQVTLAQAIKDNTGALEKQGFKRGVINAAIGLLKR